MAAFVLVLLIFVMLGSNEAIRYYYTHCRHTPLLECLMSGLKEPESEGVTATGTYTYKDFSVTVNAAVPLEGGAVSGTVSGSCDGVIKGTFDGQDGGVISGTMNGVCNPFFVNIPASATFRGSMNKSAKTIPFTFEGQGAGFTHKDSLTLTYQ